MLTDTIPEDVKLVIAPDSSSNDYEQHEELHNRGIDVLVLDHHEAEKISENGVDLSKEKNIHLLEYIYDMPYWERLADAVICRAGAMTVSEMALQKKACILIPSPNVVNNHQYENAKRLADADAAILIEEKHLTPDLLEKSLCEILYDGEKAATMRENIASFAKPDSNELIWRDIRILLSRDIMTLLESK